MDRFPRKNRPVRYLRIVCLCLCVQLVGAFFYVSPARAEAAKYSRSFFDAFDTVITLTAYCEDAAVFEEAFRETEELYFRYHKIYDNYHVYDGVRNLCWLNLYAAEGYTPVEQELMDLLVWMKDVENVARGRVNIAMGAVLSIWHRFREEGRTLPPAEDLMEAAGHTDFDDVLLDTENNTVFYADPFLKLDLGAVAKGYATEMVSRRLDESGLSSYILNAGGNIRCGDSPLDGRRYWGVGITDPADPNTYMDIVYTKSMSVVTSGDYQRYYTVDGIDYHHIIDPDTLFPSRYMHGVTVVTRDSGLADLLSTTLFNMPYEQGRELADSLEGVEAYWVLTDGSVMYTDGMAGMLYSRGASSRD